MGGGGLGGGGIIIAVSRTSFDCIGGNIGFCVCRTLSDLVSICGCSLSKWSLLFTSDSVDGDIKWLPSVEGFLAAGSLSTVQLLLTICWGNVSVLLIALRVICPRGVLIGLPGGGSLGGKG